MKTIILAAAAALFMAACDSSGGSGAGGDLPGTQADARADCQIRQTLGQAVDFTFCVCQINPDDPVC